MDIAPLDCPDKPGNDEVVDSALQPPRHSRQTSSVAGRPRRLHICAMTDDFRRNCMQAGRVVD
jgi:hypothetical protein